MPGHEIARAPAQKRRDGVGPERRHHERANRTLLDRLTAVRIEHFDQEHIRPNAEAARGLVFSAHHAGFGHAERVPDLRAPLARKLSRLASDSGSAEQSTVSTERAARSSPRASARLAKCRP